MAINTQAWQSRLTGQPISVSNNPFVPASNNIKAGWVNYLEKYPDVAQQVGNSPAAAFSHYANYGASEGRDPPFDIPSNILNMSGKEISDYFDSQGVYGNLGPKALSAYIGSNRVDKAIIPKLGESIKYAYDTKRLSDEETKGAVRNALPTLAAMGGLLAAGAAWGALAPAVTGGTAGAGAVTAGPTAAAVTPASASMYEGVGLVPKAGSAATIGAATVPSSVAAGVGAGAGASAVSPAVKSGIAQAAANVPSVLGNVATSEIIKDILPSIVGAGTSIYGYKEYADAMKEAAAMQVAQADRALQAQQQALQQTMEAQAQATTTGRADIAAQLQNQINALQQGVQQAQAAYQGATDKALLATQQGYGAALRQTQETGKDLSRMGETLSSNISGLYGNAAQQGRTDLAGQQARQDALMQEALTKYQQELGQGMGQARQDITGGYGQAIGTLQPYQQGGQQAYQQALDAAINPNSDLYRMQQEDLQKQIDRNLAARGLYGSGAGLQLTSDQMRRLAAEEAQRRYDRQVQMAQLVPAAAQQVSGLQAQQGQQLGNMAFQGGQLGAGAAQQNLQARGAQQYQYGRDLGELGMQAAQMQGAAQQNIGLAGMEAQKQIGQNLANLYGQQGTDLSRLSLGAGQQQAGLLGAQGNNLAGIYGDYGAQMSNLALGQANAQRAALTNAANQATDIYGGLGAGLASNMQDRAGAASSFYGGLGALGGQAVKSIFPSSNSAEQQELQFYRNLYGKR